MTSTHCIAIALIACASGVGVFFGAFSGDYLPMSARKFVVAVLLVLGALLGAFFLAIYDHPVWAFAVTAYAGGVMTRICRATLEPRVSERVKRSLWFAALILTATTTYFAYNAAERFVVEEDLIQKNEAQVAQALGEFRQPWHADLHSGVAEIMRDRLKVWLAATPLIEIDAEYERELGEAAQREVPICVTFLNDSFLPVTSRVEAGLTPLNWTIEVRGVDVGVLRKWNIEEREPHALQPTERRDYRVQWDGRDVNGNLVPPGDYAIVIEVTTADGQAAQTLPFIIKDSGPIEIVEVDATTEYIRHQESMSRSLQSMQEGMRMLEQIRFQRFPR